MAVSKRWCAAMLLVTCFLGPITALLPSRNRSCSTEARGVMRMCSKFLDAFRVSEETGTGQPLCTSTAMALENEADVRLCERIAAELNAEEPSLAFEVRQANVHPLVTCWHRLHRKRKIDRACLQPPQGKVSCLWLHGFSSLLKKNKTAEESLLRFRFHVRRTLPRYFFLAHTRVTNCYYNFFFVMDTFNNGWESDWLQRQYCRVVSFLRPDLLFAHSMSNNVIAAALMRDVHGCVNIGKEPGQIAWFGMQAPLKGTPLCGWLRQKCRHEPKTPLGFVQKKLVTLFSLCKKFKDGFLSSRCAGDVTARGTEVLVPTFVNQGDGYKRSERFMPQLWCNYGEHGQRHLRGKTCRTLASMAEERMSGSLCGLNSEGVGNATAMPENLRMIGAVGMPIFNEILRSDLLADVPWEDGDAVVRSNTLSWRRTGNDGIVPLHSCQLNDGLGYSTAPTARWYHFNGNHLLGACSMGDEPSHGRESCVWMNEMARTVRQNKIASLAGQANGILGKKEDG